MTGHKRAPDFVIFLTTMALIGIGLVMIFSASSAKALVQTGDGAYFLKRQAAWGLLGLVAMFFTMRIDFWHWRRWAAPIFWVIFALLIVVLIPGVGVTINGSRRWIGAGPLNIQPSEAMKFGIVLYLAELLTRLGPRVRSFLGGIVPALGITVLVALAVLMEPDLGTAVILGGIVFLMLFAAGAPGGSLAAIAGIGLPLGLAAIWIEPYRRSRFFAFLDPQADPLGSGYHIIQALYALGSGRFLGVGLMQGHQKFWYLPEQHTDFIFAVIGEELGFIGTFTVIALLFVLAWRGYLVAMRAPDHFAGLLATGITSMIAVQALLNIGVVTASLPITGTTLPFISFGGSSLLTNMAAVGVLLNISRYSEV